MQGFTYRTVTFLDLKQIKSLGLVAYGQFKNVLSKENWEMLKAKQNGDDTFLNLLK